MNAYRWFDPILGRYGVNNFVPLQTVIRQDADSVFTPLFQRLVDLQLGEGGVSTEHHLRAGLLLPFDLP